jgi:Ca2+-binding EF-hand superfamily protein
MKNVLIAAIATLGLATAAVAFEEGVDADGDGVLNASEMVAAYPTITNEVYSAIDTDGDGNISEEELEAAITAGLLEA